MTPIGSLGPRVIRGGFIALEPLSSQHRDLLRRAVPAGASRAGFSHWWDAALLERNSGNRIAFAVRRLSDGALVGSTSYLADVPAHARIEVGSTWYVREAQGGLFNPEAKLPLLTNAFETCGYNRVELKCDAQNARSRAAILKLGASLATCSPKQGQSCIDRIQKAGRLTLPPAFALGRPSRVSFHSYAGAELGSR